MPTPDKQDLKSEIHFHLGIEKMLSEISQQLFTDPETDPNQILGKIGQSLKVDRVYLLGFEDDPPTLKKLFGWESIQATPWLKDGATLPPEDTSWLMEKLRLQTSLIIKNYSDLSKQKKNLKQWLEQRGVQSMLLTSMVDPQGNPTGLIGLEVVTQPKQWRDEELEVLKMIGKMLLINQDRLDAQQSLSKSKNRYKSLLQTLPYGILEIDLKGTILFSNQATYRIFDYTKAELIGLKIWDLFLENESKGIKQTLKTLKKEQPMPTPYVLMGITKNQERLRIKVDWNYRFDNKNRVSKFLLVLTDITRQKRTEEALQFKQKELEEAFEIQKQISNNLLETTSELNKTNRLLQEEVNERRKIEAELTQAKQELENRVALRTQELKETNESLRREVHDRMGIERALRQSQLLYFSIVEDQTELIHRFKPDYKLSFVNGAYCRYFDKHKEQLLGECFFNFIPEEDQKYISWQLKRLHKKTPVVQIEHQVLTPESKTRWHHWSYRAIFNDKDEIIEYQAVGRDISEKKHAEKELKIYQDHLEDLVQKRTDKLLDTNRKLKDKVEEIERAEASLKESEELFRQLAENIPEVFWISELPHNNIIYANPSYETVWENSIEELYQNKHSWKDSIHEEDRKRVLGHHSENGQKGHQNLEYRIQRKDGSVRWIWSSAHPVKDRKGKVYRIAGIAKDITERKQAEFKLERFKAMLDQAGEAILLVDAKTQKYIDFNQTALKYYGYEREEFMKLRPKDIEIETPLDSDRDWEDHIKEVKAKGRLIAVGTNRRKDGSTFPVEVSATISRFENIECLLVMVRDITKRVRAEEEKRKMVAAIEQTGESIVITDTDGLIQYVNPAFEKTTGYGLSEVLGRRPNITKSDQHDAEFFKKIWQTIKSGKIWRGNIVNRKKTGDLFEEAVTISPIRNEKGQITNFMAVKRDMSYQNQLEKQIRESQKLEAVGTLAGGMAHDFNNILCAIMGYITMVKEDLPPETAARKDLEMALRAGEYAEDLIDKILAFSRQQETEQKPVRLSMIVKESLKMLKPILPSSIEVETLLGADEGIISADPTQIQQVIMNLLTNSHYAMKEYGGLFEVRLMQTKVKEDFAVLHEIEPGDYLKLTVKDTGCGIEPEIIERIFDPFFTTKPVDQGTGLGLAVVHGIVKKHKGTITVHSILDKGTTVDVYFPKIEAEETKGTKEDDLFLRGHERILLVDDEELLLNLLDRMLSKMGYHVMAVNDGEAALALLSDQKRPIDILITDQTMPKIKGMQLAQKALTLRPGLPIVLLTGYDPNVTLEKARAVGIRQFVTKPVLPNQLSRIIRSVLDQNQVMVS